jgi:hypothetical protein
MDVYQDWFAPESLQPIIARQAEVLREAAAWPHETVPGIAMILDDEAVLEQFARIVATPIEPVARRRDAARRLGLDRLPDAAGSLRRRLRRKWRQWTANVS